MEKLILSFLVLALGMNLFANDFKIKRGVNVSHWLSQTNIRGKEREKYVTEDDFKQIKAMGFDHVRLPVDEEQFWTENGQREKDAFKLLDKAIKWCLKYDLKVIVDLHTLRSHHFNIPDSRTLWEEEGAQKDFINFWRQLSEKLKKYPNNMVAYEMMNEAVSDNPEDWNKLINWAISEVRKLEPERTIVMGSVNWQQAGTFPDLCVPEGDKNIILSFHSYTPLPFTHWKAPWTGWADYDGSVQYPGEVVPVENLSDYDQETVAAMKNFFGRYNKESFVNEFKPAIEKAKELGLPLYCGEFGCFPTTSMKMRQQWYHDIIEVFNENGIAWAHWNWKNDFPLVDQETLEPISKITNILLPQE
ncbi:MAG: glycoside hydrolase family 5 protein [Fidelibacterota bacterium]